MASWEMGQLKMFE